MRAKRKTWEEAQAYREAVKSLYANGMTLRAIATMFGVSYQAVHQLMHRMGVRRRPRGGNMGSHSRHRK